MKIKGIELNWFRGAANSATLELNGKSCVVYGANGSGKSSFVDAVEFSIKGGRVEHLAHEYSGNRFPNSIPNVNKPEDECTRISISFIDGSSHKVKLNSKCQLATEPSKSAQLENWDCARTVLRQADVSKFIEDSKTEKYSKLLPLLGLTQYEIAADNIRKLCREVETQSNIVNSQRDFETRRESIIKEFGSFDENSIKKKVQSIAETYTISSIEDNNFLKQLAFKIDEIINNSDQETRTHSKIQDISNLQIFDDLEATREACRSLSHTFENRVQSKIAVVENALQFVQSHNGPDVDCPGCGRPQAKEVLEKYLAKESEIFERERKQLAVKKNAFKKVSRNIDDIKRYLKDNLVSNWKLANSNRSAACKKLENFDTKRFEEEMQFSELALAVNCLKSVVQEARRFSELPPKQIPKVIQDKETVNLAKEFSILKSKENIINNIKQTISFLKNLESEIRSLLSEKSENIRCLIVRQVQEMWNFLNPNAAITDIHFYSDGDKAIEVGLTFHGHAQASPRLTLSEGYRNSLGLCIFLAMAKQTADDNPLFLDDVIISLDREHRGMVTLLLLKYFQDRQIVVLTHDRTWFLELKKTLGESKWSFASLFPYETPEKGITWNKAQSLLDEAKLKLEKAPHEAGNLARKHMDLNLPAWAEKLQLKMPYLRAERNDIRDINSFLVTLSKAAEKKFKIRATSNDYEVFQAAIDDFEEITRLFVSWGNRSSHTDDMVTSEARKLIECCEIVENRLTCTNCKKAVYFLGNSGRFQCECSHLAWKK